MLNPNWNDLFVFVCLAVITGSPFYFRYWIQEKKPVLADEINRKTTQLSTLIFVALFAGAFLYPKHSGKIAQVLLGAAILAFSFLYQTRGRYVNRLSGTPDAKPEASLRQSAAKMAIGLSLCGIIATFHGAIFILPFLIPFMMPLVIRAQYPCSPMIDSTLKQELIQHFSEQKIALSEIYIIDEPSAAFKNALISGSKWGRGTFGRTLFLTLNLFEALDAEELKSVVLHEAAHLKMNHIPKRIFASLGLLLLSVFWITLPVCFMMPGNYAALALAAGASLFVQYALFGRVVYRQEIEADLASVRMGASSNALISALVKLMKDSRTPHPVERVLMGMHHPSLAERVEAIRNTGLEKPLLVIPQKSFLSAYSLLVVGVIFWSAQNLPAGVGRNIASVEQNPAKIAHLENTVSSR